MKKCIHCGEEMEDDEEFCPVCGYEAAKIKKEGREETPKEETPKASVWEKMKCTHFKYGGVTGFVIGIVAFLLGGNVILGIVCVLFSYIQIRQDKKERVQKKDACAFAGLILGCIVIILYIISLILSLVLNVSVLSFLVFFTK